MLRGKDYQCWLPVVVVGHIMFIHHFVFSGHIGISSELLNFLGDLSLYPTISHYQWLRILTPLVMIGLRTCAPGLETESGTSDRSSSRYTMKSYEIPVKNFMKIEHHKFPWVFIPNAPCITSMYGIFIYTWAIFRVYVGKYAIHGASGHENLLKSPLYHVSHEIICKVPHFRSLSGCVRRKDGFFVCLWRKIENPTWSVKGWGGDAIPVLSVNGKNEQ